MYFNSRNFMVIGLAICLFAAPVFAATGDCTDDNDVRQFSVNGVCPAGTHAVAPGSKTSDSDTSKNAASGSSTPSSDQVYQTTSEVTQAVKSCSNIQDSNAKPACNNPNSTAGMSSSDKTALLTGLAVVAQIGAQIAAAKGSATACMLGQGLSTALQALTMLKSKACGNSQNQCKNTCEAVQSSMDTTRDAINDIPVDKRTDMQKAVLVEVNRSININKVNNALNTCKSYDSNQNAMAMQMASLAGGASQMANCASQTSDDGTSTAATALTSSAGDCSDAAYAATSVVCICKSDPSNALCSSGTAGATGTSSGLASGGVSSPGVGADDSSDGNIVDTSALNTHPEAGKQAGGSGGGGAGGGGSGGGGGLNPEGGDGTGASGINKDVITGQSGAGSGGLSAAGGGGSGGGSGGRSGSGGSGGSGFNLAKYLPKNAFKNRGLAGMTVPAQDGVTGPLGPSIWEKVQTRYEDKRKSTLTLDK